MSGGRGDGRAWPVPGSADDTIEVGDREGMELCSAGLAVPVPTEEVRTETRPAPETRAEARHAPAHPAAAARHPASAPAAKVPEP